MGYCDIDDAWLIALTRQRRQEYAEAHRMAPLRFSASCETVEFAGVIACVPANDRSKARAKAWRIAQWRAGNRTCFYCRESMINVPRKMRQCVSVNPRMVTVDHREPIVLGGDDAPWNYAMCCWQCNNDKGAMTEAEFRSLMEARQIPPAWVDGGRLTA